MNICDELQAVAQTFITNQVEDGQEPTGESIRKAVGIVRGLFPGATDGDVELVARRIEQVLDVVIRPAIAISEGYQPWLDRRQVSIDPYFWSRYRQMLVQQGLSPQVVATLGSTTDRILDLLHDPTEVSPWDRRGLVMGSVQSGKTANYVGLLCKAADAGFKVLIVIAGIHNNLRNQTQARIDEGFIGRHRVLVKATAKVTNTGVGMIDPRRHPAHFTDTNRDFNKASVLANGLSLNQLNEPAVFVIKKNPRTLANLLGWLRDYNTKQGGRVDAPMLLIDDEADNASINVAYSKDDVSKINGQIRDLLALFEHSAYVGYTATPFANIFIDPDTNDEMLQDDLFPRSFIVSLDPPSNYIGARRVFLDEPQNFLRYIDDNEDLLPIKHKKKLVIVDLPSSLKTALRSFIVARAIRVQRGQGAAHSSMLVNASYFIDVQKHLAAEIQARLDEMKSSVRVHGLSDPDLALQDPEVASLKAVFDQEYATARVTWEELQPLLWDAIAPIKVAVVNSQAAGALNYREHAEHGLHVIAVGGFALSRGLTLEGLSTTYFLRNSIMYDTLLQMGRWFGYRPDYDDLCRIWLPEDAAGWYAHIAGSVEELREDLRQMEQLGGTPEDFGLKVRAHPDNLIVTARNKAGRAQVLIIEVGLGNKFIETVALRTSSRDHNLTVARHLVDALQDCGHPVAAAERIQLGYLLQRVPREPITEFIRTFANSPRSIQTVPDPVVAYIDGRPEEMQAWDVLITSLKASDSAKSFDALGVDVTMPHRKARVHSVDSATSPGNRGSEVYFPNMRFSTRGIERAGLTHAERAEAERIYAEAEPVQSAAGNVPDWCYRAVRKRPLFVLSLLSIQTSSDQAPSGPWPAWSISFPPTGHEERTVKWVVNQRYLDALGIDPDGPGSDAFEDNLKDLDT